MSRVDITLCQHGKFPATLLLKFFVLYYENLKNSKLCENTPPCGRRVSTQYLIFPISTRVDITVYNTENILYFLNIQYEYVVYTPHLI